MPPCCRLPLLLLLCFCCFLAISFVFQAMLLSFMEFSLAARLLFYFMVETFPSGFSLLVLFAVVRLLFGDSVLTNFDACSIMVLLARRVPEVIPKVFALPLLAAFCGCSCSLNGLGRLVDPFQLVTLLLVFCTVSCLRTAVWVVHPLYIIISLFSLSILNNK